MRKRRPVSKRAFTKAMIFTEEAARKAKALGIKNDAYTLALIAQTVVILARIAPNPDVLDVGRDPFHRSVDLFFDLIIEHWDETYPKKAVGA